VKSQQEVRKELTDVSERRHSDHVYQDIITREDRKNEFKKRWFWELLQNAQDAVEDNETVDVKAMRKNNLTYYYGLGEME
jgi:predicted kinase